MSKHKKNQTETNKQSCGHTRTQSEKCQITIMKKNYISVLTITSKKQNNNTGKKTRHQPKVQTKRVLIHNHLICK